MYQLNLKDLQTVLKKHKILSCVIQKEDQEILRYFSNKKMETSLQTINSITKTVVGLLIGIAIDEGLISDINRPIIEYFEDYHDLFDDPRKKGITLKHLLTMTDGLNWPEFGEWNFFAPMVFSSDITAFILARPMLHEPGVAMNYNSGASHLLGVILQKVSGETMHDFARTRLFEPLNIQDTLWHQKQGVSLGSDGLRIKTDDLIKIGELILKNDNSLVPSTWIDLMMKPCKKTYLEVGHYGYHLWMDSYKGLDFYFGLGYGGQFLMIIPKQHLVLALTSRLYKDSLLPLRMLKKHLFEMLL